MRKFFYGFILFLFLGIAPGLQRAEARVSADKILYNGKVFTADQNRLWAQAVAVRGKQILAVGSDKKSTVISIIFSEIFSLKINHPANFQHFGSMTNKTAH
jgi:hypothetical protein